MDLLKQNSKKLSLIMNKRQKNYYVSSAKQQAKNIDRGLNKNAIASMKEHHKHLQTTTNFNQLLLDLKNQLKHQLNSQNRKMPVAHGRSAVDFRKVSHSQTSIDKKIKVLNNWLSNEGPTIEVNLPNDELQIKRKASQNICLRSGKNWRTTSMMRKKNFNQAIHNQEERTKKRLELRMTKSSKRQQPRVKMSERGEAQLLNSKTLEARRYSGIIKEYLVKNRTNQSTLEYDSPEGTTNGWGINAQYAKHRKTGLSRQSGDGSRRKTYSVQIFKGRNMAMARKKKTQDKCKGEENSAWQFEPW